MLYLYVRKPDLYIKDESHADFDFDHYDPLNERNELRSLKDTELVLNRLRVPFQVIYKLPYHSGKIPRKKFGLFAFPNGIGNFYNSKKKYGNDVNYWEGYNLEKIYEYAFKYRCHKNPKALKIIKKNFDQDRSFNSRYDVDTIGPKDQVKTILNLSYYAMFNPDSGLNPYKCIYENHFMENPGSNNIENVFNNYHNGFSAFKNDDINNHSINNYIFINSIGFHYFRDLGNQILLNMTHLPKDILVYEYKLAYIFAKSFDNICKKHSIKKINPDFDFTHHVDFNHYVTDFFDDVMPYEVSNNKLTNLLTHKSYKINHTLKKHRYEHNRETEDDYVFNTLLNEKLYNLNSYDDDTKLEFIMLENKYDGDNKTIFLNSDRHIITRPQLACFYLKIAEYIEGYIRMYKNDANDGLGEYVHNYVLDCIDNKIDDISENYINFSKNDAEKLRKKLYQKDKEIIKQLYNNSSYRAAIAVYDQGYMHTLPQSSYGKFINKFMGIFMYPLNHLRKHMNFLY